MENDMKNDVDSSVVITLSIHAIATEVEILDNLTSAAGTFLASAVVVISNLDISRVLRMKTQACLCPDAHSNLNDTWASLWQLNFLFIQLFPSPMGVSKTRLDMCYIKMLSGTFESSLGGLKQNFHT